MAAGSMRCPMCGNRTLVKGWALRGRENVVAVGLAFLPFAPAVAYYWDRTRRPYCTSCKRRVWPDRSSKGDG